MSFTHMTLISACGRSVRRAGEEAEPSGEAEWRRACLVRNSSRMRVSPAVTTIQWEGHDTGSRGNQSQTIDVCARSPVKLSVIRLRRCQKWTSGLSNMGRTTEGTVEKEDVRDCWSVVAPPRERCCRIECLHTRSMQGTPRIPF